MTQLQRLNETYDIVTKYGCFDYEFIIFMVVLIVVLYFLFNIELFCIQYSVVNRTEQADHYQAA